MKVRGPKMALPRRPKRRSGKRRPGPVTGLLAVVAAGAVVAAVLSVGSESPGVQVSERTVTVARGVIETVVSGSGNLEPARQAELDFATSGRITKIYAEEGQHVSKGELLARVDDRSARVALAKAQADLVDAQDALDDALEAASTTTETAAAVEEETTTIAVAAQATPGPSASPAPSASATPSATATPEATRTPAATATPQSNGGGGTGGGTQNAQSVESAQAAVDSAELALDEAEDGLEHTRLRAPMAGTVASISGAVGDTAGSSGGGGASTSQTGETTTSAFITLAALSRLKMEVALSEADISKVEVGQSVTVAVNAAADEQVAGKVTSVGVLSSSSDSGSVSYPVMVTLDQSADGIRAGMSATADIVVDRATGIAVPSQALRGSSVTVDADGQRETRRVETGVVGESMTEVVSGLEAGERVVITSTSAIQGAVTNAQGAGQQQRGTGALGGAGGFGGGAGGFRGGAGGAGGFAPPGGGGGGGFAVPRGGP